MPSLSCDITSIDLPNVVSLVTGRQHLKPDLTNGKKIYLYLSEFKLRVFSLHGEIIASERLMAELLSEPLLAQAPENVMF